jgi:hypothetical protein
VRVGRGADCEQDDEEEGGEVEEGRLLWVSFDVRGAMAGGGGPLWVNRLRNGGMFVCVCVWWMVGYKHM